ncbi:hypothetical protein [Pseudomonas fluorescens]|uniref:Uncharacterized protein n=1 Tax=Pseudomonas fluorescens TaxID=294 RepID=A0A5E7C5L9_PSEFL|nr:hypothetical protein [Pseudomonas fluorescens]VVN99896.1 hypothetical protein PS710_02566 [Pseudomonas fluorescens]
MQKTLKTLLVSTLLIASAFSVANAQPTTPSPAKNAVATPDNAIMLTVFLKHDQSRSLPELKTQLEKQGYYEAFPPEGVEVVSWNTVMGIGQIVTLRFPASRLIEVNLAFERTAWGSFKTEFYPTYDAKAIALAERDRVLKQRTTQ